MASMTAKPYQARGGHHGRSVGSETRMAPKELTSREQEDLSKSIDA